MTVRTLPRWASRAAVLPLRFAQVREDAALDLRLAHRQAKHTGAPVRALLVASGGCTAAALAASPAVGHLHLVDPNPAQLALTRVKLHLLATADTLTRLRVLGHVRWCHATRARALAAILRTLRLPVDALGPPKLVAGFGPDHGGRYERLFAALRGALAADVRPVLRMRDPVEQGRAIAPGTELGDALDAAYEQVFDLANLVLLFGEAATANPLTSFARHFAARTRHVLGTQPAADNPYLWQVWAGAYPRTAVAPWLTAAPRTCSTTWSPTMMDTALRGARPGSYDLVHLSNILDWLSPSNARTTLELAHAALRRGGTLVVRQLNSALDVRAATGGFEWDEPLAAELHAADRSFFYRELHIGVAR